MVRTILSILIAPGIAATLITAMSIAQGNPYATAYMPAYYMVTYWFAFAPAAILLLILKGQGYTRFWHYVSAGCICSLFSTIMFALSAYSGVTSFAVQMEKFLSLWPVMAVGPVAAGLVWIVSEANWLRWPSRKSTADNEVDRS